MIGVIMFLNSRGDIAVSRTFRDGFNVRGLSEMFRNCFISTGVVERCPINVVDGLCFVHVRVQDLYLVLVSDQNVNCFLCVQYALQLLDICRAYFDAITEETLKENSVALQTIIDETMDFGYPQLTGVRVLKSYINKRGVINNIFKHPNDAEKVTKTSMGKTPWRSSGHVYRINELFVDVFEEVSVLLSQTGHVLENSATGQVLVRNFLSGMPECRLVLNDDFSLEDIFCHPCVRAQENRVLEFVPVDGAFLLMRYRAAMPCPPPLIVQNARVVEVAKTRIEMEFVLKCEVQEGRICKEVEVRVPCPESAADVNIVVKSGEAHFDGVQHTIIWSLPNLSKNEEVKLSADIMLVAPTLETPTRSLLRPPIKINFKVPSHTLSGFGVRELKVEEPIFRYTPKKWVHYMTDESHRHDIMSFFFTGYTDREVMYANKDYINPAGLRMDGRRPHESRRVEIEFGGVTDCDGCCTLVTGLSNVCATVYGPCEVTSKQEGKYNEAIITCDVAVAAFAGERRRDPQRRSKMSDEISTAILEVARSIVLLSQYPNSQIHISLQVLRQDGNDKAACINAACLALVDASVAMRDVVYAQTVGLIEGTCVVDLTTEEIRSQCPSVCVTVKGHDPSSIMWMESNGRVNPDVLLDLVAEAQKSAQNVFNLSMRDILKEHAGAILNLHGKMVTAE